MSIGSSIISGLGSLVGGYFTSQATKKAAEAQMQMQQAAMQQQQQMYGQVQNALNPFLAAGQRGATGLTDLATSYTPQAATLPGASDFSSFVPTINSNWSGADLENTPGYQFTRDQALKSITNSAAAKGLGTSGTLLRGIGDYTSGLASQTYQQQYQNYVDALQRNFGNTLQAGQQDWSNAFQVGQQGWNNAFQGTQLQGNLLQALSQLGLNAGNSLAGAAQGFSGQANQTYSNMGNAQAQSILGSTNALTSGMLGATNALGQYSMLSKLGLS